MFKNKTGFKQVLEEDDDRVKKARTLVMKKNIEHKPKTFQNFTKYLSCTSKLSF